MFIIALGQNVSILIESSSGPSKEIDNNEQESLLVYNVTKNTQSAYMNAKLHKSNKLHEINDIDKPSLSV